jgi:phosphatidate phosphatase PAH1
MIKIEFIIDLIWGLFLLAYVNPGDGELASSPFHVRFGKIICTLLPQEKKVC